MLSHIFFLVFQLLLHLGLFQEFFLCLLQVMVENLFLHFPKVLLLFYMKHILILILLLLLLFLMGLLHKNLCQLYFLMLLTIYFHLYQLICSLLILFLIDLLLKLYNLCLFQILYGKVQLYIHHQLLLMFLYF